MGSEVGKSVFVKCCKVLVLILVLGDKVWYLMVKLWMMVLGVVVVVILMMGYFGVMIYLVFCDDFLGVFIVC